MNIPILNSYSFDKNRVYLIGAAALTIAVVYVIGFSDVFAVEYSKNGKNGPTAGLSALLPLTQASSTPKQSEFDAVAYQKKLLLNANISSTTSTSTRALWPAPYAKTAVPKAGALLPFHRIIAYYGNFYSTKMGVLGEYPPEVMIPKLQAEVAKWNAADPATPAIPAIDYIVVTAQGSAGQDGKYRFRMPDDQIQKAITLADQVHGIVVLDVQVGLSTLPAELPRLEPYLEKPEVHLAIDPEFSMKSGDKPGTVIGTYSSSDVNYAITFLQKIVQEHNLPPKVLVVHRFTENMVTGVKNIQPVPEVQVVMDMDGWGSPAKKLNTYDRFVHAQPVEFTGFKLFYKNDIKPPSTRMLTPAELLKLTPQPLFIQFQ